MNDAVEAVLGFALFVAIVAACAWFLLRRARASGVLLPVAVGLGLRVALMVAIHLVSLSRDEGGIMFLDDRTYLQAGMRIASAWDAGTLANPGAYDYAGTYMFGYQALLAGAFALIDDIVVGKIVNVLASAATVLLVARISVRIWSEKTARRAAWLAALAPGLVWWAAPLMKEAVSAFLVTAAVLAVLHIGARRAAVGLFVVMLGLALTRAAGGAAVLFVGILAVVCVLIRRRGEVDVWQHLRVAAAVTVLAAAGLLLVSGGDPSSYLNSYEDLIDRMIGKYRNSGIVTLPIEMAKAFVSPYPWTFDKATHNWDMGLYPGMWFWYALYPLITLAVWRHRQRPEVLLLVGVIVVFLAINAFTAGFIFRQRSSIDPLVIVLAVGALSSWRALAVSAAGAWGVVAFFAALQSDFDPITIAGVLTGAGAMFLLSKRLPERPLSIDPQSPIADGLRRSRPADAA